MIERFNLLRLVVLEDFEFVSLEVEDWLTERRRLWEARLDQFDEYVRQLKEKESKA